VSINPQTKPEIDSVFHTGDAEDQYLTFMLAAEEYGLEILKVQEIKGWEQTTPVPNAPSYVLGVINIRGEIVPIIDLRIRFDLESVPPSPTTVIVVITIHSGELERTIGLVVDAVSEVYRFEKENIQEPPATGDRTSADCINGLASFEEKMVLLLDVDRLIDFDRINEPAAALPE